VSGRESTSAGQMHSGNRFYADEAGVHYLGRGHPFILRTTGSGSAPQNVQPTLKYGGGPPLNPFGAIMTSGVRHLSIVDGNMTCDKYAEEMAKISQANKGEYKL
jgi:hypothetical protein